MRVVSWNIAFRGPETAKRQGKLLRELAPHLMLLQEVNPGSSEVLRDAQTGPLLFGADANTPKIDGLDFANTRTHWPTGR